MQVSVEFTTSSLTKKFAPNTTATELQIHFNDLVYLEGKHIMSDGIKSADLLKLKEQAESLTGWFNINQAWLDTSEDSACAVVGHISEEGALYPVAVIDCDQYDAPLDSMKLAKFYAASNPKAVLEIIATVEAQQAEIIIQTKRIVELEREVEALRKIKQAAENLVNCKGRYHTEQNMIALANLLNSKSQGGQ